MVFGNSEYVNMPLFPDNPVRIGPNNELWVGTDVNGNVASVPDLCHDVGACLLGGKLTNQNPNITFDTFNSVTAESLQMPPISATRLQQMFGLDPNETSIPDTTLLDELVKGTVPYRAIRYTPTGP
jgi:hypothetical protein